MQLSVEGLLSRTGGQPRPEDRPRRSRPGVDGFTEFSVDTPRRADPGGGALATRSRSRTPDRSSGKWRDDDYDVLENGVVVGRICGRPAGPPVDVGEWAQRRAAHGYEATREAAMAAFAKSWRRE